MDINKLYECVSEALNLVSDDMGYLSQVAMDKKMPATVGGKRLVLPTRDILRKETWENAVAFHPICENILRQESPVLQKIRNMVLLRLHLSITTLASCLLELAADTSKHSSLNPDQSQFLAMVPDADAKLLDRWNSIHDNLKLKGERAVVSLYLKRRGKLDDTTYRRVTFVKFPLITAIHKALDEKTKNVYDVGMRVKDTPTIKALFEYILPDGDDKEKYSYGSDSDIAPYFHCLINAFGKVAGQLNTIADRFKEPLGELYDTVHVDLSWLTHVQDLAKYADAIPPLAGNEGAPVKGEEDTPSLLKPDAGALMAQEENLSSTLPVEPQPSVVTAAAPVAPAQQMVTPNSDMVAGTTTATTSTEGQPLDWGVVAGTLFPQAQVPQTVGYNPAMYQSGTVMQPTPAMVPATHVVGMQPIAQTSVQPAPVQNPAYPAWMQTNR